MLISSPSLPSSPRLTHSRAILSSSIADGRGFALQSFSLPDAEALKPGGYAFQQK